MRAAMSVELNHTIVRCRDRERSAGFLADILGRPAPSAFGPFLVVELDNGVSLDFYAVEGEVAAQHYAFLIGDADFDAIFARLQARGLQHWADPGQPNTGRTHPPAAATGVSLEVHDGHPLELHSQTRRDGITCLSTGRSRW